MITITGRISVIMPCFNAESFLREALDSVLNQTYPDIELIVVDDGSTDNSRNILDSYGNRLIILRQENQGPYPARNLGASKATGEFIAFLDADDWWNTDCLDKLYKALISDPSAVLSYCGWQNVGLPGGRGAPYVPPDYELEDKTVRFLRAAAPWPIHAALLYKNLFDEVGGFHLDLGTCMDYDLWVRIGITRPIVRVPEVMAFYRHHKSGQITSTQWRQAQNSMLVKRKFIRSHPQAVAHLSKQEKQELVEGGLLRRGYDNFWRRDLVSAQRIFRLSLINGGWKYKDLKYLLPSLLSERAFQWLVGQRDS